MKNRRIVILLNILALCFSLYYTKPVKAEEMETSYTVQGKGSITSEKNRLGRSLSFSELYPTPHYVKKGELIDIEVTSSTNSDSGILIAIGTPSTAGGITKKSLVRGSNKIMADRDGVISLINRQNNGIVKFKLNTPLNTIPFFELGKTSNLDFKEQMNEKSSAPVVQLVSKKALITVSYASAKKYISNPEELMAYYDKFLFAQDKIEGTLETGRGDYLSAQHLQHYVEANSGYMFATNEYTGYYGSGAMERLLKTNNGWGVWHESGHQRQMYAMTFSKATEVIVNLYSMAAQKAVTGRITTLDAYHPQIQNYLASSNKNYESQSNYVKLGLYWQLMDVFGDSFYPQLHQRYRLLEKKPQTDAEEKQVFIIESSKVANLNLVPFFEMWGISATGSTKEALKNYPELDKPIWLNTNTNKYRIGIPHNIYIPELAYFKNVVKGMSYNDSQIQVAFDVNWLKGYKYVVTKNNNYLGEVSDGKAYGGEGGVLNNNYTLTIKTLPLPNDKINVEAHYNGVHHLKTYYPYDVNLENQLLQLFTDNARKKLVPGVTQELLDTLLVSIQQANNKDELLLLYDTAQTLLLHELDEGNQYNAIQQELGNLIGNPAFKFTESSTAIDKWALYRNNVAVSNASTSITLQQPVDTDGNVPTTNASIKMKKGAQVGELQGYIKDDNMLIMGQTLKTIANHKYRLTANRTGKSAVVLYDGTNVFSGSKGGLGDKYSNGVNQRVELVFTAKSTATSVGNRFISDKSGNWQVFGMSDFQVFDITEAENQGNASEAVNNLFTNKDPNGTITETVTQAEIDAAQALINKVTDPAKKAALQADLNKAQSQLDAKTAQAEAESEAREAVNNLFTNKDPNGTITGTMTQAEIDAAQALINKVTDPVKEEALQADLNNAQSQLDEKQAKLVAPTIHPFVQGDKYITGTVDPAAKRVAIYVNGTLIRYASVTGSSYSIYATDITTLRTVGQTFEVVAVNASGQEGDKASSTVNAKPAVELPAPILKAFYRGDKAITGTVDANAKKIALYVNGVFVRYGSITGTSYSIYASDVALLKTVGQTFEVVAVNESGVEGKRTMGTVVSKETVVTPTDVTTKSSYAAGSVTGVVARVGLYVDGTLVRYGSITDGQYKVYIQDVAALKTVGKEFELRFLDSDSTVIRTVVQTVQ